MDGAARRGALAALLLLLLLLLAPGARGSPTPPGAAPQDTCTSCGFRRPPDEPGAVDADFLQAVKRHILSRLQMRDRPNITHAVPKAAMVTALRKLHAGKVRDDGRVEIPSLDGQASAGPPAHEQTSEIISFAETGSGIFTYKLDEFVSGNSLDDLASSRVRLHFFISNEGNQNLFVVQASLWLYLKLLPYVLEKGGRRKVRVKVYFQDQDTTNKWNVVEKKVDVRRSGWHTFPMTEAIQALFEKGERRLNLDVQCEGCEGSASSFHTAVVNQYRIRKLNPNAVNSCCIPTKLSSMSMLYFDDEYNIVKRDVPNMIVEECGCA
uniref:Uncharacterized protein n=1 Tax=Sphaerodactylus townsendi TaxID=933632 RepID=A0ACB8G1X3_9SAUR